MTYDPTVDLVGEPVTGDGSVLADLDPLLAVDVPTLAIDGPVWVSVVQETPAEDGTGSVLVAGALAVLLALVHLYGFHLPFIDAIPRSRLLSFGGGVSVAYVFVHLIPELARTERFDEMPLAHPALTDESVYLVALVGFVTFYGLERAIAGSKDETLEHRSTEEPPQGVYWVHVAGFVVYNAIVGYLLFHREEPGVVPLVIFGVAMAMHFLVNDFGLRQHYREAYQRSGRWLLAGAVLAGAAVGLYTTIDPGVLEVLFSFLAGAIILNTIKEELPESRQSQFSAFALGSGSYAALLVFV